MLDAMNPFLDGGGVFLAIPLLAVVLLVIIVLLDHSSASIEGSRRHSETRPILPSTTKDISTQPLPRVTPPNGPAVQTQPAPLTCSYGATDNVSYTRRPNTTSIPREIIRPTSPGHLSDAEPQRRLEVPSAPTRNPPQPQPGSSTPRHGPPHPQDLPDSTARSKSLTVPSPSAHAAQSKTTQPNASDVAHSEPYSPLLSGATTLSDSSPQQCVLSPPLRQYAYPPLSDLSPPQTYSHSSDSLDANLSPVSSPLPERPESSALPPQLELQSATESSPPPSPESPIPHCENPHYKGLRKKAHDARARTRKCFLERKQARRLKQTIRSRKLTQQLALNKAEMIDWNTEASEWIYNKNNENRLPTEIDLHNLFVKEAIHYTDRALAKAASIGAPSIKLIVGKGKNSKDGVPRIKPEVEKHLTLKCESSPNMQFKLDPRNEGVFLVRFGADSATKQSAIKGKKRRKNETTNPVSQAGSSSSKRTRRETT